MLVSDFDYRLPDDLIAQTALEDRAASRLLVLDRATGHWEDRTFRDLPDYLSAGDCLVVNDTRVFPARLFGRRAGSEIPAELFLLKPLSSDRATWTALARPGRRLRPGAQVEISEHLRAEVLESGERGERVIRFTCAGDLDAELDAAGHVPLPPYIHRSDTVADRQRYQTVYAAQRGSVAAPTAGLHFTPEVLNACQARGALLARVTLHVGLGTFQPLRDEHVEANHLHTESYAISADSAATLVTARRRIAVGTTSVRVLETASARGGLCEQSGETDIFIYPGYRFQAVDALLTNFHLPQSSLLMLVSAFAGRDFTLAAYNHAVRERYRFFSYGDCMLIL